nr:MAG TPA: hypothetical protein [Caudoviricetes sp.]DAY76728.1 MAG TPA: hypothetical protein [Caudoviricetes sp.]
MFCGISFVIPIMIILPRYYKYEKAWEKEVISYL